MKISVKKHCRVLALLFVLSALAACYDLETELRILPDGSGFVTTWVRVNSKDAKLAAALSGVDLDAETLRLTIGLREEVNAAPGVEYLDEVIYEEGDKLVLRYRLVFDNIGALNRLWRSESAKAIPALFAGAQVEFQSGGASCGTFITKLSAAPRDPAKVFLPGTGAFSHLDDRAYGLLLEKFFSGAFRLRVAPPGKIRAADAHAYDVKNRPIYEKTLFKLLNDGLKVFIRSEAPCESVSAEEAPEAAAITLGPAPSPDQLVAVLRAIPWLVDTSIEFTQVGRSKATVRVVMNADKFMGEALDYYISLVPILFPRALKGMKLSRREGEGGTRFIWESQKPINFAKLKNPVVFLGRDGGRHVFRMKLPQLPFSPGHSGGATRRVFRVKVSLLEKISMSNATTRVDNSATWIISDKTLANAVTLEALSE